MAVADCYDSLKSNIVSGEMKMYARMCSVAMIIWMMAAPIVSFITLSPYPPVTATLSIVSSVILGCIELPFTFRCFPFCIKMQERLAFFGTRLWLRFILNLVIATIFIIIGVHAEQFWYVWVTAVCLLLVGLMYLFASFRGETDEGEKDRATTRATAREMDFTSPNGYSLGNSAAPPPVHDLESGVAGAALEAAKDPKLRAAAIDVAQKNPELAAEALKAAAKYARKV